MSNTATKKTNLCGLERAQAGAAAHAGAAAQRAADFRATDSDTAVGARPSALEITAMNELKQSRARATAVESDNNLALHGVWRRRLDNNRQTSRSVVVAAARVLRGVVLGGMRRFVAAPVEARKNRQ